MIAALHKQARIYIHCSAGIHRTGMITHGFLRHAGLDATEARAQLKRLRVVTSESVGEDRMTWGERFYRDRGGEGAIVTGKNAPS